jgi:deoxynucleoside triphosphate triphosphohydrolase SAMHD1
MKSARVIDGKICYPEKECTEIKKLFDSRYNLYKDCYNHRVAQSFECLVLDILKEASTICDWTKAIRDADLYNNLDDSILHEIRISEEPEYAKARDLLARFDSRKHYSFVGEKVLSKAISASE